MFPLLVLTLEVQNTICNFLINIFTKPVKFEQKSDDSNNTKFWAFWPKVVYHVNHFAILKDVSVSEIIKIMNQKTSIIHYSKNNSILDMCNLVKSCSKHGRTHMPFFGTLNENQH